MKKALSIVLSLMLLVAISVPSLAAPAKTVYLKGTGSEFNEQWNNVFYLGGSENDADPSVWHLVYTGKKTSDVISMQLDFGENGIWEWDPSMGFSTNAGGKNPGWVVIAPYDWAISYVNNGKNNESNSFLVTTDTKNVNFNISGFHQGSMPNTFISIEKFVTTADGLISGEGFEFDVFPAEGPFDVPLATLTTDDAGYAEFTFEPALAEGDYIVRERLPEGYAPVEDLRFTVGADGVAVFEDDINYIINIPYGALEVTDDVVEMYYKEYHKPVYDTFSTDNSLSSVSDTIIPGANWFRYVTIDVSEGSALYTDGIQFEIARSSRKTEVEGIGYHYTVTANEDGELVISFDDELISASIVARAFASDPYLANNGGHLDIVTGETVTAYDGFSNNLFVIPADADEIYLYVHFGALSFYETDETGERIIVGCEFDYEEGPFERLFPGEVTMIVLDADGNEVYVGPLGLVEDLLPGDYTVTIYADGAELASKTVTVLPGETANADFGKLIVPELGEREIVCPWCTLP